MAKQKTKPKDYARMTCNVCSGGHVTVKPGQTAYEAQQEQLKNQPAGDDTTASTKAEETSK